MASITKRGSKWRVQVKKGSYRATKTFRTKQEAAQWALKKEAEFSDGLPDVPVKDLFERYIEEVAKFKAGSRPEILRLRRLQKEFNCTTLELSPPQVAEWRDKRLKEVKSSTVNREWNLLSHVFNVARTDWGWLKENPASNVRRPKDPPPRNRRPSDEEIERLKIALDYGGESLSSRVIASFLFAIETAMRAGEICSLDKEKIDLDKRTAFLPKTKNGTSRTVPLSQEAMRLLKEVDYNFNLKPSQIDTKFRTGKKRADVEGLTFHDSRREALTRLATKLDVMTLAKVSGHIDLKILQNVYYSPELTGDLLD